MDMRTEIANAAARANVHTNDLRLVRTPRHHAVLVAIAERFTTLGQTALDSTWWWEHFRPPVLSKHVDDAFKYLPDLLPDDDRVWFVAEDWPREKQHGNYWLYDATARCLPALLGEMFAFEYYVISKHYKWLVAENHHDVVFAVGTEAIEKLERFTHEQTTISSP